MSITRVLESSPSTVGLRRAARMLLAAATCFLPNQLVFAGEQPVEKQPAELTVAEFEKLHKDLQPPKDELWRSIPWQVSILEGRELAAKTKKPIFVWVASGEPLGCG